MRPGSHAAEDGSFGRSAGIQAGRAALLIAVAVLIGFLLLRRVPGGGSVSVGSGGGAAPSLPTVPTGGATGGSGVTIPSVTLPSNTSTATTLKAPKDVKVLVANGTGSAGLASRISEALKAKGYTTLTPTDTSAHVSTSMVYFQPGYGSEAAAVASKLNLPATAVGAMPAPSPVSNLGQANVLVVAGPNLVAASGTSNTSPTT